MDQMHRMGTWPGPQILAGPMGRVATHTCAPLDRAGFNHHGPIWHGLKSPIWTTACILAAAAGFCTCMHSWGALRALCCMHLANAIHGACTECKRAPALSARLAHAREGAGEGIDLINHPRSLLVVVDGCR